MTTETDKATGAVLKAKKVTVYQEYWRECIANAFEEHGITATPEQINAVGDDCESAHDSYGMAFYQPPPSDRMAVIKEEAEAKLKALQREFDRYRDNAETAVKRALRQFSDANVSIGERGEVFRHGGRTEQIQ